MSETEEGHHSISEESRREFMKKQMLRTLFAAGLAVAAGPMAADACGPVRTGPNTCHLDCSHGDTAHSDFGGGCTEPHGDVVHSDTPHGDNVGAC